MAADMVREVRSGVLLTGTLAGLVAAIVGGVVWGLIVRWTDYEIGFAAWGIGFIVGTVVVLGAQHTRGLPFQLIAVVLALFGIVLGKYLAFVWIGQDELGDAGFEVPVFSKDTFDLFWDLKRDIWSGWDLLWAGLAVVTAFRIPQVEHAEATEPANSDQLDEPAPGESPEARVHPPPESRESTAADETTWRGE
jgi:hypothetical protein